MTVVDSSLAVSETVQVPMGTWVLGVNAGVVFLVPGVGSCIALALFVPESGIAAMAHILLPQAPDHYGGDNPAKYADTAVAFLAQRLAETGATPGPILAKAAGGAQMFRSQGEFLPVGVRNVKAVRNSLDLLGIPLIAEDFGGNRGRTVKFFLASWRFQVSAGGKATLEL